MAAPILWAPGIFRLFLLENSHAQKFLVLAKGGGGLLFLEEGVSLPISFLWAWDFSENCASCSLVSLRTKNEKVPP